MSNIDLDKGGRIPQIVDTYCGPSTGWIQTDLPTSIEYVIDGGGGSISAGQKGFLVIPFWLVVNDWILLANISGNAVVDIWNTSQLSFPPTIADSITGSVQPTLSGQQYATGSTLTGWTTMINQGDVMAFVINSISSIQRLTIVLECKRIIGQA